MTTDIVKDYYGKTLQTSADLKTEACCTPDDMPSYVKRLLSNVHDEVLAKYYGCGLVTPLALEGARILDLGSGSGRDVYALAQLVGPKGEVVGVDMTDEQIAVARAHVDWHRKKFGYKTSNVRFLHGYIERLDELGLEPGSFDIIVSNCVINLSPDKLAVLRGDVGSMRDEALRASEQDASVDHLADQGTDNYDQGFMLGLIENGTVPYLFVEGGYNQRLDIITDPEDAAIAQAVIAMADIGTMTPDIEETVATWVRNGGVLVRFAGPRLAAATDSLIPVNLRHGDRTLGGSLTWQTPQPLASFSDKSPFAGLKVPDQRVADGSQADLAFLAKHAAVVVKPVEGEQGKGISVNVTRADELLSAIERARQFCDRVLIETFCPGQDLRVVVIDYRVVAAAVRRPPAVVGDGASPICALIEKQSRRRQAATGGESRIPMDDETRRCVARQGYTLDDILPAQVPLTVRNTANLHTGGTIHDVTDSLHPVLRRDAEAAARALDIPVTGLDFMVPDPAAPEYVIIEANERPGLANHEPQPTAERFVDLLFPRTRAHTPSGDC